MIPKFKILKQLSAILAWSTW